jgi:hypothetical protein
MMQSSIWQMVHTRTFEELRLDSPEGSAGRGCGQIPHGGAPPPPPQPPVSLDQLLATQNYLMRRLVENDEHRGAERQQPRHQERDSSYSDFLATHPPVFADATNPLEADSWLHTTESKFGLLHCTEYQKTLYTVQQLRGAAGAWWASYIATLLMITMFHGMTSILPSCTSPIYGSAPQQAEGFPGPSAREPQCIRLHEAIEHPGSIWHIPRQDE